MVLVCGACDCTALDGHKKLKNKEEKKQMELADAFV